MSLNSLLIDSGSKGWADLFVDTIKVYNGAEFQGDTSLSGDLIVGNDMSVGGFIDVADDIFINSEPIYIEEVGVLNVLAQGVIKNASTVGYTAFKIRNKISVILNRALNLDSADTGNDGKIIIQGVDADYRPFGERFTTALINTPSGSVVAKCKIDTSGTITIENIDNSDFTASTGDLFQNSTNIVFEYNTNNVPNN